MHCRCVKCFVRCFEGPKRSHKSFQRSVKIQKYRDSLYDHHQNTLKRPFMAISVFRWTSCDLSKYLNGHQGQILQKHGCVHKISTRDPSKNCSRPLGGRDPRLKTTAVHGPLCSGRFRASHSWHSIIMQHQKLMMYCLKLFFFLQ